MIDREALVTLASDLVAIRSVNPTLVEGESGEDAIVDFLDDWCTDRGLEVRIDQVAPGRRNLIAVRRGRGGGRSLLLNAHTDTVGAQDPATFTPIVEHGALRGRGALDTKGGLACALLAIASFAEGELAGDLVLGAVCDEENLSIGTEVLVAAERPDGVVVVEPTGLAACTAHRGFAVLEVAFTGRRAHTSEPEQGVNAVHLAVGAAERVLRLDASWHRSAADPSDPERPTVLVSRIGGGVAPFTVPGTARMTVEIRAGPDLAQRIAEVREAIGGDALEPGIRPAVEFDLLVSRPPLVAGPGADGLAATLRDAVAGQGRPGAARVVRFWTDAALHSAAGQPAVVFGPGGEAPHGDAEWVSIDDLVHCAAALRDLARTWCNLQP